MQILQWCCMTLIIIESIASKIQSKPTVRSWNNLINGHEISGVELLLAINDLSLNSETIDDQVILYDAPINEDEAKIIDNKNVKSGNGNEELLKILAPSNFNNKYVETRNQQTLRRNNRIAKQTKIGNNQHLDSTDSSVEEPSRGYLPEGRLQTIIPAPEPTIISGDTYFSKELQEPIEVPISGSILKPNNYQQSNPVSRPVTFPRAGLVRIPPPVLIPIVVPISQLNSVFFPRKSQ